MLIADKLNYFPYSILTPSKVGGGRAALTQFKNPGSYKAQALNAKFCKRAMPKKASHMA